MYYVKTQVSKRVTPRQCVVMRVSIGPFLTVNDASLFCTRKNINTDDANVIASSPQSKIVVKPTQIQE
jgi:hypothetical protein